MGSREAVARDRERAHQSTALAPARRRGRQRGWERGEASVSSWIYTCDQVTLNDSVENVVAANDSAKNGVVSVQMRLRRVGDEVLTAPGVRTGKRHADGAALITVAIHLVADGIARTTIS